MPATHTYSPIFHVPATARTQLAPTCRYAQYAETPTPLALVGGSAKRCAFRGMTVVARSEAKGEMGGGNLGGVTWRGACRPYSLPLPQRRVRHSATPQHVRGHGRPQPCGGISNKTASTLVFTIHHSSFIIVFHLLRQRTRPRNRPILLRLTVLQLRFEHLVERGSDEWFRSEKMANNICF